MPFVTQYHPALPNLKNIPMGKWQLIQIPPYLRDIFKEPPLISYRKGKSLKDTQVRANLNYKGFKTNLFANCRSRAGPSTLLNLEFQPVCSVSVPLGNKTDQKLSSPFLISKTCILIYKTCPLIHDMKHARIEIKFYNLDTFKKQIASRTNSKNRFCLMRPPARLRQTLQSAIRECTRGSVNM